VVCLWWRFGIGFCGVWWGSWVGVCFVGDLFLRWFFGCCVSWWWFCGFGFFWGCLRCSFFFLIGVFFGVFFYCVGGFCVFVVVFLCFCGCGFEC